MFQKPGYHRPFVPQYPYVIFLQYNNLAHTGIKRTSSKTLKPFIVWPNLNKDVSEWGTILSNLPTFENHKTHVRPHLTFQLESYSARLHAYRLNWPIPNLDLMNDHATRWLEVTPISNMSAKTVVNALIPIRILQFGCPSTRATIWIRSFLQTYKKSWIKMN